jgi:hypothetical protein
MKKSLNKVGIIVITCIVFHSNILAQKPEYGNIVNIIPTAVPFLSISPDSRSGGFGGAGVATSPDIYSQFWNPAKYAFIEKRFGIGLAFTPWLRQLISDINLYNLTSSYRLDEWQVISGSIRYFSIGQIIYRESYEDQGYTVSPNEFAIDLGYNRRLSDHLSGSVAFRYIRSDLNQGMQNHGDLQPGNSFAADVSFYYIAFPKLFGYDSEISAGINVSNIGSKISYNGVDKEFIPTNLRLGTAVLTDIDEHNSITFSIDANKLLVPTPSRDSVSIEEYRNKYNRMNDKRSCL